MDKHMGSILRKVLEENGVTPEEFALVIGRDVPSVNEIFNSTTLDIEFFKEIHHSINNMLAVKLEELSRKEQALNKKNKELDDVIANNNNILLRPIWN